MKKLFFIVMACSLFSTASWAQDVPLIDIGLKAGPSMFWESDLPDGLRNDVQSVGFVAGVWARFRSSRKGLYIQPELVISRVVSNVKTDPTIRLGGLGPVYADVSTNFESKFINLELPILVGQRFSLGAMGIRVNTGPVFSTNLSAKSKEGKDLIIGSNWIGFQFGAGVDISKFDIDLRYQLSDAFENDWLGAIQSIQLTLGYKIL